MDRPSENHDDSIRSARIRSLTDRLDSSVNALLERRPKLVSWIARYGFLLFVALAALFVVAGFAAPQGRGQQIVYATDDGSIVSVAPESGERTVIFSSSDDGGFATAPLLNGGSRSLSFTVLRDDGDTLRGDLYSADLVRGTRSIVQVAQPREAYLYGGYSGDRTWLSANRFSTDAVPNVAVLSASGATMRALEPGAGSPPLLGPAWMAQNSLYAWREVGDASSLTAYDIFERRQAVIYRTEGSVGLPSYNFDSNTTVFDERPAGNGLERSRLVALAGTDEMEIEGAQGLGLYDPSLPVPDLDHAMAVMWTDGEEAGVGLFDPATWKFEKTGVKVARGSREPGISYDGDYVATLEPSGDSLTVRRLEDGEVVLRLDDVQPRQAALDRLSRADYRVPESATEVAPAPFAWRSVEGS